MQLIQLCGGSGKRLWPLSNGVRSKQFLKLLEAPDGRKELMFQRVIRQTREAGIDAEINIATSEAQYDSVVSQALGQVSVIIEPMRRDTFPAIALAAEYLAQVKNLPSDEIVVVMPCDAYTDLGYFEAIKQMAGAIERNLADLILMGIQPSEPSSKYGYIVPLSDNPDLADYFVEKPEGDKAVELISRGALWNGGVFAFRLGYIRKITENYLRTATFEDFRNQYDRLPKISFDYEVVEKAASIGIVRYDGKWKDLGTWPSLCEELTDTLGNVTATNNHNTTVINELQLPVICSGMKDVIVAASSDGILVADKQDAESIKDSVTNLNLRPMYEERRWGSYRVLDSVSFEDGISVLTKRLILNPGCSISYQRHSCREEVWTVINGQGEVVTDSDRRPVCPGDVVVIPSGTKHALRATTELTLIEVQRGTQLVEEDIERFDYQW